MYVEEWLLELFLILSFFGLIYITILSYRGGKFTGILIVKIYLKCVKHIDIPRDKPSSKKCLYCNFGEPIIYDQEYDCCMTCKSKWKV